MIGFGYCCRLLRYAAFGLVVLAGSTVAADLFVSSTGTQTIPYASSNTAARSIQVAVDLALNGDTVWIMPGTYTLAEEVSIEWKSVTVRSQSGDPNDTIVNGNNATRCFYLSDPLASLIDLTIQNGIAPPSTKGGNSYGGGVYIENGGIVSNVIVQNCSADFGGGIRIRGSGEVQLAVIRFNTAKYGGAGIQIALGGTVADSTVHDNIAVDASGAYGAYGGGIYCWNGGNVEGCTLYNNRADYGGGIRLKYLENGIPSVSRCRVYSNIANYGGGGIQVAYRGSVVNSLVYDNIATLYGGGVYLYQGGDVHSCTIAHNNTVDSTGNGGVGDGYGGGIFADGGTVKNSNIVWNKTISARGPNYYNYGSGANYQYCNTAPWISGGNNIVRDPKFEDADARNYYLLPNSPCLDAGTASEAPSEDFTAFTRPLDGTGDGIAGYDIGAYEYKESDDADRDGMPTYWEVLYGLDPKDPADGARSNSVPASTSDSDSDGLWNIEEFEHNSNPLVTDSDSDGLNDFQEVYALYQPSAFGFVTEPDDSDTDGDGFDDKYEIDNDSDPTDASSLLTSVSGSISYSGSQTGPVFVVISNATVAIRTAVITTLGAYTVTNLPTLAALTVTAYRDSNSDGTNQSWEAYGEYASNPVTLTGATTGIDLVLSDPDTDEDGLTDFEEIYTSMTDPFNKDSDGDGSGDGEEVNSKTDPTDSNSVPVDISGLVINLTPSIVTGDVYVVLNLESNGNEFASYPFGTITNLFLSYAITNVPSPTNFWPYAFIDINSNATYESYEPYGAYVDVNGTNWIAFTNDTVVNFQISDSTLDTDEDGLSDYDELFKYFTSTNNVDTDGDDFTDSSEMVAGTNPLDDSSFIGILDLSVNHNAGGIQPAGVSASLRSLSWAAVEGRDYRVEVASTPMGPWVSACETITATNSVVSWDDDYTGPPPRFFRIIVLP